MNRISKVFLFGVVMFLLLFWVTGCGNTAPAEEPAQEVVVEATAVTAPEPTTESDPSEETSADEEMTEEDETVAEEGSEAVFVDFDPGNFSDSASITNKWLPLQPGTKWVLDGSVIEGEEEIPHRIEFIVTDLTKEIAGVNTVVAWIVDISDGEIVEKEIAFYAQDDAGNVWYLGEHPEEYEAGEFVAAPTWIAGVEEALPGVKMWAEPQIGSGSYYQGWAPAVEWSDFGQIDTMGAEDCVVLDCYQDVMVIAESSLGEENIFQLKSYAPGVGNMRVGWRGEAESREDLELVELTILDAEALAEISAEALALDAHAYEISPAVYGQTSPAVPMGDA